MKERLSEKGITLIALVITIIVLLILAGVSIAMLTGDNGILTQAQRTKNATEIAAENETEMLDEYNNVLNNYINNDVTVTAKEISNSENKDKYYGAIVDGYTCENDEAVNNWKILYSDGNNIYLIADDYISTDYCPLSKAGNAVKKNTGNYKYGAGFSNIYESDYMGATDIPEIVRGLNSDYFNNGHETDDYPNIKAIAYLSDIEAWNKFKGNNADYAIGGPTIELIIKSYNEKYLTNYQYTSKDIDFGYTMSSDGIKWSGNQTNLLNVQDSLYVINSDSEAYGMWLSSPGTGNFDILCVEYDGSIEGYSLTGLIGMGPAYYNRVGFRPVVRLNTSVELQENTDGTFTIK